jgi:hypothetical protein
MRCLNEQGTDHRHDKMTREMTTSNVHFSEEKHFHLKLKPMLPISINNAPVDFLPLFCGEAVIDIPKCTKNKWDSNAMNSAMKVAKSSFWIDPGGHAEHHSKGAVAAAALSRIDGADIFFSRINFSAKPSSLTSFPNSFARHFSRSISRSIEECRLVF